MEALPEVPSTRPDKAGWKRILIPGMLIGGVSSLLLWAAVRGNWADDAARNPATTEDGVVRQLLQTGEGHKELRAAVIVRAAADRVWAVVTDYDHFAEIFPNTTASKGVREADGRWHLTGEVKSLVGRWPVDVHVKHEEMGNKMIASWDEPHDALKINRGNWTVTRQSEDKTLLEYHLELKVTPFPSFVVRAMLLEQLEPVMEAVRQRAEQKASL
jgi:uncharacterized protein YndB with AHSA1/START domain